jgi:hypothetical protein
MCDLSLSNGHQIHYLLIVSWVSSVSVVTGCRLYFLLSIAGSSGDFPPAAASRQDLRPTDRPVQRAPGVGWPAVVTTLTSTSVEVEDAGSYTTIPSYDFMAWCLTMHSTINPADGGGKRL